MKTIKTLLTSLFLFVGLAAQAQVIVIEKTDGTKDEYQLYEVDSVAYVPQTYYYYAGRELPKNEVELAQLINSEYPSASVEGGMYKAGGIVDMNKKYDANNVLHDYTMEGFRNPAAKAQFYVVIPKTIKIYDADKSLCMDPFELVGTICDHNIYRTYEKFRNICTIILF